MLVMLASFPHSHSMTRHGVHSTLTLSDDDAVLVAGSLLRPYSVCGYDTASLTLLWNHNAVSRVGAICMLGFYVVVTVHSNPTIVLKNKTGELVATFQKSDGWSLGLAVVEGLCFILSLLNLRPSDLHTSVCLARLQYLLYKRAKSLHLPLEMWDWIAQYRV